MKTTRRFAVMMFVASATALASSVSAQAAPAAPLDIEALTARTTPAAAAPVKRDAQLEQMEDMNFVNLDIKLSAPSQPAAVPSPATTTSASRKAGASSTSVPTKGVTLLPAAQPFGAGVAGAVVGSAIGTVGPAGMASIGAVAVGAAAATVSAAAVAHIQ